VTADEITRSQIHTAGEKKETEGLSAEQEAGSALRFPRELGFVREAKSARDATTVAEVVALFRKQQGER